MAVAFHEHPRALSLLREGAPAVLEASAGTGKTYTLTHLVADRILRGRSTIDRLLLVTFTEKATQELRQRLRELLHELCSAKGGRPGPMKWRIDDEARARVQAAVASFDAAEIFTIHGFCQRALAELAFTTGRPLTQTVVDGRRAFAAAYRRSLRRGLAADGAIREELRRALESARSIDALGDTLAWMHEMRLRDSDGLPSQAVLAALGRALVAEGSAPASPPKAGSMDGRVLVARALVSESPAETAELLLAASRAFGRTATHRLARLTHIAAPVPPEERRSAGPDLTSLLAVVEAELVRTKAATGEVDFQDMLTELASLLDGPRGAEAVRLLRRKYDAAIVDEFQDTDDTQWHIFRRLFGAAPAPQLVVVGDPKQAIYGFRGADVLTYLAARSELVAADAPVLHLSETRRSTPALTDAINELLAVDAEEPILSGLTPYDPPVTCESKRAPLYKRDVALSPVVIARLAGPSDAASVRRATARFVAEEIERLTSKPTPATDRSGPLRFSDVLVLGYTGQDTRHVAAALRARGIAHTLAREEPLFATFAASSARDVLRALADPRDGAKQRQALATPFFAVPWRELDRYRELPPSHPLARSLAALSSLAARGRWHDVFAWLSDESGLVARARLLDRPETDVATWLGVLDALAREAATQPFSPDELADLADALVDGRAQPSFGEPKVAPPLEDAVRLLTVHGSKGLESKVVFVVGGRHRAAAEGPVTVHDGAARRAMVGALGEVTKRKRAAERDEEDRRLAYVALTRAQQRLYLFHAADGKKLNGPFAPIQARLATVRASRTFELLDVVDAEPREPGAPQLSLDLGAGPLDPALLVRPDEPPPLPRAPRVTSYTAERHREAGAHAARTHATADDPVPGGARVGRAVHEVLETIPLQELARGVSREEFVERPEHVSRAAAARRRHGAHSLSDVDLLAMVHAAYSTPVVAGGLSLPPLSTMRVAREVELAYPWPEAAHVAPPPGADWPFRIDRGLVRGYVDLVATHQGRAYVVDWKTDRLPSYDHAALAAHVDASYALQAQIYAVGVRRQLALTAGRVTLGGVLYVFLRGLRGGDGVHATSPTDEDLDAWQASLCARELA